jgi:hypothetical protein
MAERVAKRLPDSGFATVDEYVTYILKTVLDELDGSSQSTPHPQAGFTGQVQFLLEIGGRYVAAGLGQEKAAALFQSRGGFHEEIHRRRHLVYYRESQGAVHRARKVRNTHRFRRDEAGIHTFPQTRPGQSLFESSEHARLDFDSYDAARRSHQASQGQREEAHARAGLENRHTFAHISPDDFVRILDQAAQRAGQHIPEPPRAHAVLLHSNVIAPGREGCHRRSPPKGLL